MTDNNSLNENITDQNITDNTITSSTTTSSTLANEKNGDRIIFLIAGEPSGDKLGANLIKSFREFIKDQAGEEQANHYKFVGVGGPLMEAEGFESLFDYSQLAVMGLIEILPKIRLLSKLLKNTIKYANSLNITAFISIDSPGFTLRVAKKLKKLKNRKYPLIHYVAPSVWAWKPKRAKEYAHIYDRILCLLPFEPKYFEKHNLRANFVGHPATFLTNADPKDFLKKYGLDPHTHNIILILLGSRTGEVTRLLPIFAESAHMIKEKIKNCKFVISAVPHLKHYINENFYAFPQENTILIDALEEGKQAMASSKVSLSASGTVALELAKYQVAQTTAYKMNPITYAIVNSMLKSDYVNLINVINNQGLINERIQDDCTPEKLSQDIITLLSRQYAISEQNNYQQMAMDKLSQDKLKIAEYIIDEINIFQEQARQKNQDKKK